MEVSDVGQSREEPLSMELHLCDGSGLQRIRELLWDHFRSNFTAIEIERTNVCSLSKWRCSELCQGGQKLL